MKAHRFFGEGEIRSIPRAAAASVPSQGFMACPCWFLSQSHDPAFGLGAEEIYRLAYEQARACAAPAWHMQSLLTATN